MYAVAVTRDFIGRHYLVGGDWGRENHLNAHRYRVEVQLEGPDLDQHGFLVDIVAIQDAMQGLVDRYGDTTLNDLPEFADLNPSIEHFARIFCEASARQIDSANLGALTVKMGEDDDAWASYRMALE